MRDLALLTFQSLDGVMQATSDAKEDTSGGFTEGGWELIQELLKHDLIDKFRLWTFPVVIGSGKRLFTDKNIFKNLLLLKSDICPSGAIMNIYRTIRNK